MSFRERRSATRSKSPLAHLVFIIATGAIHSGPNNFPGFNVADQNSFVYFCLVGIVLTIAVLHCQIFCPNSVDMSKNRKKLFHWANIPDGVKSESSFLGQISINLYPSLLLD